MKLGMLQTSDGTKLVGLDLDGRHIDLCAVDPKLPETLHEVLAHPEGLLTCATALADGIRKGPVVTGTLLAPIPDPGKVICIGLNYADHAAESGMAAPKEPIVFSKFSSAIAGPGTPIQLPRVSQQVDYEAELVVVIGRTGKHIPVERAYEYIAGYTCGNDVSARDWQIGRPGSQWLQGKTADTFAPIGPYLVTHDEIGDPGKLQVQLRLNGQTMQDSSTTQFIFGVDQIIAHLSQLMTLQPGDVIFTGTPPGVGMARKPPVWLKPGDLVEVEIEGLGVLENRVLAEGAIS